jgi:uncharacterized protein DUF6782
MMDREQPGSPIEDSSGHVAGAPGTPHKTRRPRWIMALAALLFLAVAAAFVVPRILRDEPAASATQSSAPAASWDARVQDLVNFVEQERGLTFDHPVPVNFLSPEEFRKEVTTSATDLTPKDKRQLQAIGSAFRAFGLLHGDVNLLHVTNTLGTKGVAAFYDPKRKQVYVHDGPLTPSLRATLVHELTHALQDQHFQLLGTLDDAPDDQASAQRALIEGDAQRIEQAYVQSLSGSDKTLYQQESNRASARAKAGLKSVPPVIRALFESPYVLGEGLMSALLLDGGQARIDQAFQAPPADEEDLLDPFTFLEGDQPIDVPTPALGAGETEVDKGDLGAITWYLLLAEQLDPRVALGAVDGWGGDSYVIARSKDRFCVRAAFQGDDASETDQMQRALSQWVDTMPRGTADVTRDGEILTLSSCDPGTDVTPTKSESEQALLIPLMRTYLAIAYEQGGADRTVARCASRTVIDRLPADTLLRLKTLMNSQAFGKQLRVLTPDAIGVCQATSAG